MQKKQQGSPPKRIKRSPWPRGWRSLIHRKNDPLSELPDSHPAKLLLFAHGQCRRDCIGREIEYRGHEHEAFDQEWQSQHFGRRFQFSNFAYAFISYDLILEEWLSHPLEVTENEKWMVARIQCLGSLLDECEEAAKHDGNTRILVAISQIRKLNELHIRAIRERWKTDKLAPLEMPIVHDVKKTLGW
jgi:hypothetical protein